MALIILHYGPYDFKGVVEYRPNRLKGLIERLDNCKIKVFLKPSVHMDRLTVEVGGTVVFTCRMTYLKYNSDGTDYCSDLAFSAIMEALRKIKILKSKHFGELPCHPMDKYGTQIFPY